MTKFELKENLLAFETFRTRHGQELFTNTHTNNNSQIFRRNTDEPDFLKIFSDNLATSFDCHG